MKSNIALVGFMATGKTTVGKALAEYFGLAFVDTDEVIAQKHGKSIPEIFLEHGEVYFREQETLVLKEFCGEGAKVIATGGGAILKKENVSCLLAGAHVICLTAKPETVLERTKDDVNRPLLQSEDRLEKINNLMQEREQHYNKAEHIVKTDEWDLEAIIADIESFLKNNGWTVNN